MDDSRRRGLKVLNYSGKIEIEGGLVEAAVVAGDTGTVLKIDMSAIASELTLPDDAELEVQIKDVNAFERSTHLVGRWSEMDPSAVEVALPVGAPLQRMSFRLQFVRAGDSRLVASSGYVRMPKPDNAGEEGPTDSIIAFEVDSSQPLAATAVDDPEMPLVLLGKHGPESPEKAREDYGFMVYAMPAAIEKFALMLLADEGVSLVGDHWDAMRRYLAQCLGANGWEEVQESTPPEDRIKAAWRCAAAFSKRVERQILALAERNQAVQEV